MIMKKLIQKTIIGFAVLLSAVTATHAQTVDPANPYAFEKKAYKPDGTPWTGPVNVGDIIKYVLSYKPGAANSGPATIDDTLSPNQTYVAPTVGPGWVWSSAPYSTGNHETYNSAGFGPGTGSVNIKVGTPAVSTTSKGYGDGTIPVPILSLNKAFGVFHHSSGAGNIDCWDLTTLAKCGSPKPNAVSGEIITPLTPQSVVRGTKIYFPGFKSGNAVIGCFDGATNSACPETVVPHAVSNYGHVGGVVEDGAGRIFIAADEKVFCFEGASTLSNCAGWPAAGLVSVTSLVSPDAAKSDVYLLAEHSPSPTRIYIHHGSSVVQCIDTATATPCAGGTWTSSGVKFTYSGAKNGSMLSSLPLSGSTGDGGVCLWNFDGAQVGCVDRNGTQVSVTAVPSLGNISISSFRIPGTGKVFFPAYTPILPPSGTNAAAKPICYEFTNLVAAACTTTTAAPPLGGSQYGFALDPLNSGKCLLALGHDNLMWRFDYNTGEIGCDVKNITTVKTPPIEDLYCNGAPDPAKFQWNSIKLLTSGAAGTLTITQGSNAPITLTVVSGTTSYTMPAGIGAGYGQLTFSFAPTGSSPASVDLEIGYTSDKNPEICYQAKVEKCGPVFNDAIFKGSYNGAPVSVPKKVDLGQASGPDCPPPPPAKSCLDGKAEVTCGKVLGTYNIIIKPNGLGGVVPTSVTITPLTTGITLSPAKPSYQVIGGQVQVTVLGAHPGDLLEFEVNGTTAGGGSVPGVDLCCNGKIKVEIPKDLPCKDLTPVDIAIQKTGGTTPAPQVGAYSFNLNITNEGPAYTAAAGVLTVTDTVPAGMVFNSVSGTAGWTCTPNSAVPAGTLITCTYAGGALAAGPAAPIGSISISATALGNAPFPDFTNCANVALDPKSGAGDSKADNNKSCVTVSKNPKKSEIKVQKICDPVTEVIGAINHFEAKCHITVTSTGPQSGTIVVSEAMTGGTVLSATAPAPWNCTTANCSINGSALNQTSSSTVIDIVVKINQGEKAARNCARLSQTNANPIESCVDIVTNTKNPVNLEVVKTGPKNCLPNAPCPFTISVTSLGQPYSGNVLLFDKVTPNPWSVVSIVPNICGSPISITPFTCVANLNLAANTPYVFTVTLNAPGSGPLENENCVGAVLVGPNVTLGVLTPADANALASSGQVIGSPVQSCWRFTEPPVNTNSSLTVTKTCDPAVQIPGSKMASANCHITVTGSGTLPPVIKVNESFNGLGNAANQMTAVTSAQNWGHPPLPIADGVVAPFTLPSADLLAAGGTSTIDVKIQLFDLGTATESKNCVDAVGTDPAGTPMVPAVTAPKVCVNLTATQPPVIVKPVDTGPKCDLRTTKPVNDTCRCIIQGQTPISKTACGCPKGTELQRGQCVKPKPECQQGTRFSDARNRCEPICKNGQEYNPSRNVCLTPKPVCKQGTRYNPATNSCVVDKPVCKRGQAYDAATNRCINIRPVCQPGTQYNPKRNTCVPLEQRCPPGTLKLRGQCVDIPRCRFPQIPIPGTGICVNPFGGSGRPPQKPDGGAVPGL
jgi:uncharacterized repeat protein (TIGR01451 family)